jgi:hypothetical protein
MAHEFAGPVLLEHREHELALCMETQDSWPTGARR